MTFEATFSPDDVEQIFFGCLRFEWMKRARTTGTFSDELGSAYSRLSDLMGQQSSDKNEIADAYGQVVDLLDDPRATSDRASVAAARRKAERRTKAQVGAESWSRYRSETTQLGEPFRRLDGSIVRYGKRTPVVGRDGHVLAGRTAWESAPDHN